MRPLVQPPPSMRCETCHGELRFKAIETSDRAFELEIEIFVCANCGREQSYQMGFSHYRPHTNAA